MLQQILRDMYIEPELLVELSDEQKQILFLKMREEQVRRFKEYEDKLEKEEKKKPKPKPKPGKKRVNFLKGNDGNEWVWVMGEYKTDKTIEEILEEEAQQKAREQANREAEELRRKEEEEIKQKMLEKQKQLEEEREREKRKLEEEALYQSIKEARLQAQREEEERKKREEEEEEKKALEEVAAVERRKSRTKIDSAEKRRSNEIYIRWKEMRKQLDKVAEESSQEMQKNWVEQEKKSKEAEEQMRLIARRAREEHRTSMLRASNLIINANRLTQGEKPPLPPKTSTAIEKNRKLMAEKRRSTMPRPPDRDAVVDWFHKEERSRNTLKDPGTGKLAEWFHGLITRMDAEKLLLDKPQGSYLVRVSEKVWGYTISYRASDRCKHFLIDASEELYHFFGPDQLLHNSIVDIVNYHKTNPITVAGNEILLYPCGQVHDPPDYLELIQNRKSESTPL